MRVAIPPLPQYDFMAWSSVKEKYTDNFTFTSNFYQTYFVSHGVFLPTKNGIY